MSHGATIWWVFAGIAVAAELITGTFYLLMIAFGLAAAALASHLGAGVLVQMVAAAFVGSGGVLGLWLRRKKGPQELPAQFNPNVNLDIGEVVQVAVWNTDRTANVQYRGANWTAMVRTSETPQPGSHRVVELHGNRLVLERI